MPLNLANIGGEPARFAPFVELYRRTGRAAGHDPARLKVGISGHLHVARDSQRAMDDFYPHYARYMAHNLPNRDRGWQVSRADYAALAAPRGSLFVGSPQQIVDKILYEHELFGHIRFKAQIDIGGLPFAAVATGIELLATEVLPPSAAPPSPSTNPLDHTHTPQGPDMPDINTLSPDGAADQPIATGARIGHVHLKVSDLARSLAFYCGVLERDLTWPIQ